MHWTFRDVIVAAMITAAALLGLHRARRRPLWGLRWENVHCPNCGRLQPAAPWPSSFRQALRGGFTCKGCGRALDKNGRLMDPAGGD